MRVTGRHSFASDDFSWRKIAITLTWVVGVIALGLRQKLVRRPREVSRPGPDGNP
jgi:hypothetical protein